MPLTVANTELMIVRVLGKVMTVAQMDVTTTGNNPNLALPISLSASEMGQTVADMAHPVDADLAGIANADIPQFLSRVRLQTLRSVLASLTQVDIQEQDYSEKFSQLADRVAKQIADMEEELAPAEEAQQAEGGYPRIGEIKAGTQDYRIWPPGLYR